MKQIVVFDDNQRRAFLPLAFTRPLGEIHVGSETISNRWGGALSAQATCLGPAYLKTPLPDAASLLFVNARLIPNADNQSALLKLKEGESLWDIDKLIAFHGQVSHFSTFLNKADLNKAELGEPINLPHQEWLMNVTDLFEKCGQFIQWDFDQLERNSEKLPDWVIVIGDKNLIHVSKGAELLPCTINTKAGPVIISEDAKVSEQCALRGPLAIGKRTQLKMSAKVYGPSSFGPECRIGGEVSNSVVLGYSNKGHDGFMGNSVIGEWCNLGADTNTSNLKNNYSKVRKWSYITKDIQVTDLTFCGLIMGDHSKCGINTMFNTATTVGVGCNIYGGDFPEKFVPDFSWGGKGNWQEFNFDKFVDTAQRVMQRRGRSLNQEDVDKLRHIFSLTQPYRTY